MPANATLVSVDIVQLHPSIPHVYWRACLEALNKQNEKE